MKRMVTKRMRHPRLVDGWSQCGDQINRRQNVKPNGGQWEGWLVVDAAWLLFNLSTQMFCDGGRSFGVSNCSEQSIDFVRKHGIVDLVGFICNDVVRFCSTCQPKKVGGQVIRFVSNYSNYSVYFAWKHGIVESVNSDCINSFPHKQLWFEYCNNSFSIWIWLLPPTVKTECCGSVNITIPQWSTSTTDFPLARWTFLNLSLNRRISPL